MRLLDQYVRKRDLNMRDEDEQQQFLNDLAEQLRLHKDNQILIHGLRVQAMFAYVAPPHQTVMSRHTHAKSLFFYFWPPLPAPSQSI